jgi:hypothetical protein
MIHAVFFLFLGSYVPFTGCLSHCNVFKLAYYCDVVIFVLYTCVPSYFGFLCLALGVSHSHYLVPRSTGRWAIASLVQSESLIGICPPVAMATAIRHGFSLTKVKINSLLEGNMFCQLGLVKGRSGDCFAHNRQV